MQTQTYIVTGGNSGLGYQCARFLGAIPENLVVVACRDLAKGAQAAGRLEKIGCAIKVLPLDLASFASVHKFVEEYRRSALPPLAGVVGSRTLQLQRKQRRVMRQLLESVWVTKPSHLVSNGIAFGMTWDASMRFEPERYCGTLIAPRNSSRRLRARAPRARLGFQRLAF